MHDYFGHIDFNSFHNVSENIALFVPCYPLLTLVSLCSLALLSLASNVVQKSEWPQNVSQALH